MDNHLIRSIALSLRERAKQRRTILADDIVAQALSEVAQAMEQEIGVAWVEFFGGDKGKTNGS